MTHKPLTQAQSIIAAHTSGPVDEGAICKVNVDFAFVNDITGAPAIKEFYAMGAEKLFDPARCAALPDHFTPNKDIASAIQTKAMREFARRQKMLFWEVGRVGVEHAFLAEEGYILPGMIILGADSHTCTGGALGALGTGVGSTDLAAAWALGETWLRVPESMKAVFNGIAPDYITGKDFILALIAKIGVEGARYMSIEFHGEALKNLPLDDRMTMSNMAVEAGGKCGLFAPDKTILDYVTPRAKFAFTPISPDADAKYAKTIEIDASALDPVVALPHLPDNVKPAKLCGDMKVDQVFIGSCTNGRLRDMEMAASILKGKKAHHDVRLIVIPASYDVYNESMRRGYIQTFIDAGASVCTPTCGPCLGGYMGILAPGERCVSTSNRNFVGRMGHVDSELILASPLVAAASAVTGRVTDPREVQK